VATFPAMAAFHVPINHGPTREEPCL
jgi:hypothetical protein